MVRVQGVGDDAGSFVAPEPHGLCVQGGQFMVHNFSFFFED